MQLGAPFPLDIATAHVVDMHKQVRFWCKHLEQGHVQRLLEKLYICPLMPT
jgi:hypothetical protein